VKLLIAIDEEFFSPEGGDPSFLGGGEEGPGKGGETGNLGEKEPCKKKKTACYIVRGDKKKHTRAKGTVPYPK